jgi:cytochrome c5
MGLFDPLRGLFGGDADGPPSAATDAGSASVGANGDVSATTDEAVPSVADAEELPAADVAVVDAGEDVPPPRPAAEALAAQWPSYHLDFSPASLARLDAFVEGEVAADQRETLGFRLGAYLGEVFVRSYDAEWVERDDEGWVVAMPGDGTTLSIPSVIGDRLADEATFAAAHDGFLAGVGIDGPRVEAKSVTMDTDGRSDDDVGGRHWARARQLVEAWPRYRLDFSVESLVRLDELLAAEYDGQAAESTDAFAGYVGEVFRRHHDGEWRLDRGEPVLVVSGPDGVAKLPPSTLAAPCSSEASFVDTYARVAADVGLSTLADE